MDIKKRLQEIIENFNINKFHKVFEDKNYAYTRINEHLDYAEFKKEGFSDLLLLGEMPIDEIDTLAVVGVKVNKTLTERSGKRKQFDLAKKILKDNWHYKAGIFIFYDDKGDFRFSLIHKIHEGKKEKLSSYKRYTYFVSKNFTNKTFINQLNEADFTSLQSLKEAFSLAKVTKEFYSEISNWFHYALDKVKFPNDLPELKDTEQRNKINLIRLLTRLIFVWFIKEKGLIPEKIFDEEFLRKILKDFKSSSNSHYFYNAILQNLFFGTLNRPIDDRGFAENKDFLENRTTYWITNYYRYEEMLNISKEEFKKLFDITPFLNGGLFECLDMEIEGKKVYIDGFSRNPKKRAIVPDYLFFNEEKRVDLSEFGLGKSVNFRGLIGILKSYNFTIDENSPFDEEVALDPELLGMVFENLLASYNPETSESARKATGSYYTPREIVNFMVDESLFYYLKNKITELDNDTLRSIISYNDEEINLSDSIRSKIVKAIAELKVIDPACGSGAFPMGMLHKLVYILQKVDPDNKLWENIQIENAIKETEEVFHSESDKAEREKRLKEINEAFDKQVNYPDYARKLYLIENCIYGVDIQPIAVQISKLRFFISLVVDQKVYDTKENRGILALPNLETKFVAANTLIPITTGGHIAYTPEVERIENGIKNLRHRYFSAKTSSAKKSIREKDKKLRQQLKKELMELGLTENTSSLIAKYDIFNQNTYANWFDPEWMFGVSDGFDIVIGNPPYIKEYTHKKAFDGLRNSPYYKGKMDIWYFFVCVGIDLLKNGGILTFIAQNNWTTSFGASKMRDKVIKETKILQLIDFNDYKIFKDAGIQTMIMIFQKDNKTDNYTFDLRRIISKKPTFKDVLDLLQRNPNPNNEYLTPIINRKNFIGKSISISDDLTESVLQKISEKGCINLTENEISQGIVIPQDYVINRHLNFIGDKANIGDGIFVISEKEKNNISFNKNELEIIKPYYTTKELKKYYGNIKNSEWIIYTDSSFKNVLKMKYYPNIKKHLDKFQAVITSDNKPYGLHRARNEWFFQGEKIISVRKCEEPTFTYTDFDCYVSATFYIIKTDRFNLKFLTGILNSKLIKFWLRHKGKMQGKNFQIDKEPMLNIPLPSVKLENQNIVLQIEALVEKIIATKKEDFEADISELERKIDVLVYQLYELTDEEIEVIENEK
ncbi:Eco57I restriction-modification methylase domain-containing protein [Deferribacter abyssi]|uniref:Eco57I restriction-modification methylase domain-containing protein n=1 Tax=Deferribacter abyssi TaxID=213806 RepID=UPI003C139E99